MRGLPFPDARSLSIAVNTARQYFKRGVKSEVLQLFADVLENPGNYKNDERFQKLLQALETPPSQVETGSSFQSLGAVPKPYRAYGLESIEQGAIDQMETAMRLPITVDGALMPDAHQGYGLPIGGVLATENAVIPYGVGVDIGCRMCLSVFDLGPQFLTKNKDKLGKTLFENTAFGWQEVDRPMDDPIFERREFSEIPILKDLKHKASRQIGSSGSGNHFVEFGIVEILEEDNPWGVAPGRYLGLLSHSGSRNLGANVARHYTRLARTLCKLPKGASQLAWLDLNTQEGQEYWKAMTLAGDYASACHHHIHKRIARALAEQPMMRVENHHNFAWKENLPDGKEVIVHRKGATPAKKGDLGIIPGSMIHPGFIVRGKGRVESLQSASHGAGRQMSRRQAAGSITRHALEKVLAEHGVQLMGGGLDEAPIAYKDIHQVMDYQKDLVEVLGLFHPKIVRMDK